MLGGRGLLKAYFDARFLTMIANLEVISVALRELSRRVDLNALHTSQKMLMVQERVSMEWYLVQFISGKYRAKPRFLILSPQYGRDR